MNVRDPDPYQPPMKLRVMEAVLGVLGLALVGATVALVVLVVTKL